MVGVIWSYNGISPDDMARRVLFVSERATTTTVNNIERIEATAYNVVGLIRVYFQEGTNVDLAVAQVTAVSQTLLRTMPPGIFPPLIVQTDGSSVPILQLGIKTAITRGGPANPAIQAAQIIATDTLPKPANSRCSAVGSAKSSKLSSRFSPPSPANGFTWDQAAPVWL